MKKISKACCILFSVFLIGCASDKGNSNFQNHLNFSQDNKAEILDEAEKLKAGYYIDEAINKLNENEKLSNDSEIQSKIDEYTKYKNSFVKYEGAVEHIFFHSLIVYPKLAFDNIGHSANGYNMWFTTVDEFKNILPQLHARGYVLFNITDIYKKDTNGKTVQQDIYLPEGKKPLILSQDDVNYYEYMKLDGFADRLVIDENDEISTLVRNNDNEEEITRDGDIVPIVDDFIKQHPDFSYKGAKGTLAVTGYEGVLGYRLDSEENREEAKKVVDKLKEDGWTFASHSYTHNGNGYFQGVQNYDNLRYDFTKWNNEIKPIIGETNIFISPFGATLEGENVNLVTEFGFDTYCNVSRFPENEYSGNLIITPRFNIDGYTLLYCKDSLRKLFFEPDEVLTPNVRPILVPEE
ncbi:MAG: hypothetical protein E7213_05525 [Clostridium sp.]|nr:hypothetical protein [Clostridium sp.]